MNHRRFLKSRRDFLARAATTTTAILAVDQTARGTDPVNGESASAAAQTGGTMPPDPPRVLTPSGADLGQLHDQVMQFASRSDYPYSFLSGNFSDHATFHQAAHAKVLESFGYRPEQVEPRAEVIERVDCGDYFRERIEFSTTPDLRVPAYVLIPKDLKDKAPAIIDLHSHGGMFLFGKEKVIDLGYGQNHPEMVRYHAVNYGGRPTATELVRHGYVVISIDAFFFGERRTMIDSALDYGWDRSKYSLEDVKTLNQHCRAKEATLVQELIYAGMTWTGLVSWDDQRTVDYLVTRPEVDAERIGCQGVSLGGYRALFLAGLDSRIKAAAIVGFMSTAQSMMKKHVDKHSWVHYLPGIHAWLDWPDIASLAAPRALMVQQCAQDDLFPLQGMHDSVDKLAAIYQKAGAASQFTGRFYDVPHQFSIAMQDDAIRWFDSHLKA